MDVMDEYKNDRAFPIASRAFERRLASHTRATIVAPRQQSHRIDRPRAVAFSRVGVGYFPRRVARDRRVMRVRARAKAMKRDLRWR